MTAIIVHICAEKVLKIIQRTVRIIAIRWSKNNQIFKKGIIIHQIGDGIFLIKITSGIIGVYAISVTHTHTRTYYYNL